MVKGFILYKNEKIPFVIDKYRMELFTDDKILNDFMQEYNKKKNYILSGVYFSFGTEPKNITILVECSWGSICYLSCYIVENLHVKEGYNEIGIQSSYLDSVFRYKYNYIDLSRTGMNFAVDIKEVYSIPFEMENNTYNLKYCIGHNGKLGLLEFTMQVQRLSQVLSLMFSLSVCQWKFLTSNVNGIKAVALMRKMLLSFKPEVYEKIKSGKKKFEHRRNFPDDPIMAYMYVSAPVKAITGIVYLGKRHLLSDWKEEFKEDKDTIARIEKYQESYRYAMEIDEFQDTTAISLDDLRRDVPGFVAPQMYIYLDGTELLTYIEDRISWESANVRHNFDIVLSDEICIH